VSRNARHRGLARPRGMRRGRGADETARARDVRAYLTRGNQPEVKQSRPSLKDAIGEKVPTFYLQKIFSHLPVVPTPCLDSAASNFACIAARCSPIRAARSPTSCACARGCCTACPLGFGSSPRSISACSESCVSFSVRTKCSDCSLTASRQPGSAELEASNSSASAADERAVGTAAIGFRSRGRFFPSAERAWRRQPRDRERSH
jgi:hypothetical protein